MIIVVDIVLKVIGISFLMWGWSVSVTDMSFIRYFLTTVIGLTLIDIGAILRLKR